KDYEEPERARPLFTWFSWLGLSRMMDLRTQTDQSISVGNRYAKALS
ncbi:MAG: hypothetical protein ACI9G1_000341, partial [Pirellulaceae bacterium]